MKKEYEEPPYHHGEVDSSSLKLFKLHIGSSKETQTQTVNVPQHPITAVQCDLPPQVQARRKCIVDRERKIYYHARDQKTVCFSLSLCASNSKQCQ